MRRRDKRIRKAFCTAWLVIIGYKMEIHCDAWRIALVGVYYVDTSSDANDYI